MEAYAKYSGENERIAVRPAELDDIRHLTTIINSSGGLSFYKAIFGAFHLPALIDLGYLSLIAEAHSSDYGGHDEDKHPHIHGFISLNDQMSVVTEEYDFESMINLVKEYIPVTINNTLLFNFWMANESRGNPAAYELIKEAFSLCTSIDFLVWICPFSYIVPESFEKLFTSILIDNAAANATKLRGYRILFSHRSNFLPKLSVRNARVEDNDDLIPIIQKSNPEILLGQDRYFLADLIQNQDNNNRFFVGLKKNYIVGMLSTSLDVNMSLIMKMFDIDAYPDLVIQSDTVPPPPPLIIAIVGDLRLIEEEGLEEMLRDEHVLFINLEKVSLQLSDYQNGDYSSSLMNYIHHVMKVYENPAQLQAVVLWGFPRYESEANDNLRVIAAEFDFILELINVSEEVDDEDDEDDEFLQQHLDGLESLREHFSKDDRHKAVWRKVPYDQDSYHTNKKDNLVKLHGHIGQCLDERMQRMEQAKAINKEKPPKANAFAITAMCIEDEFTSRSSDLLKLAFEEQPEFAYCLYMVSNQRPPSKETNCFNFIKTRPGISFDHSLYIINRAFFYAHDHLKITRIVETDLDIMQSHLSVLRPREKADVILSLKHCLRENDVNLNENPNCVGFSIKVGNNLIGSAVLTRKILSNDDSNWFRQHYHLDEVVNSSRHRTKNQYILLHWLVDPTFSSWSRVIIRHLMRMCNKTVFFYHCDRDFPPPKEIVEEFIFIRPKKVMDGQHIAFSKRPASMAHENDGLDNGDDLPKIVAFDHDSPLFCVTKSTLPYKKMIVATRVVIMGGSAQSFACLETICSVPNIYYPNIYFVVEIVPAPMKRHDSHYYMDADSLLDEPAFGTKYCGCLSIQDVDFPHESELYAMGYSCRVNIIKGRLTDIDRENRAVVVSDEFVIEYDYLLLSTYTQDNSSRLVSSLAGVHPAKCADAAIFSLGNPAADLLALTWVKKRIANRSDPVVICGVALKVLAAAEGLLRAGVEPSRIVLVVNDAVDYIEGINDSQICSLVSQSVEVAGISQVFWKNTIAEVSLSRNGFLQSVELKEIGIFGGVRAESKVGESANPTRISCTALLLCAGPQYQSCERDVFAAINDSGLVFDGGLVVDLAFRTVDPFIYGVSDYSKFSRVYREELPHIRYNPREIGIYVAMQLIHKHLHPYPELFEINKAKLWKNATLRMGESKAEGIITKPRFSLSRSFEAALPGETYYFASSLPKLPKDSVSYLTDNANSTTAHFGPIPPRRVMSMKIDSLGVISEISYAGLEKVEFRNLSVLPGQHESFLNSCVHAHRKNLVDDWIEYFRGEWAAIIFTSDFCSFVKALKQSVQADKGMIMLLSRIFEKAESTLDDLDVDDYRRTLIGAHGELIPEVTKKSLEAETAEYVREHKEFLPKYYVHGKESDV